MPNSRRASLTDLKVAQDLAARSEVVPDIAASPELDRSVISGLASRTVRFTPRQRMMSNGRIAIRPLAALTQGERALRCYDICLAWLHGSQHCGNRMTGRNLTHAISGAPARTAGSAGVCAEAA
jgi:hypothetical protein